MAVLHIKIKKNPLPEQIFLEFMLLLGLFFGYFEVTTFWNAGIILLTAWLIFASKRIQNKLFSKATPIILLFILIGFFALNVFCMGTGEHLSYNIIQIIRPIIILLGFYYISLENNNIINDFLNDNFILLNLMWIVNLIIIGFQVAGTGFMIKDSWMEQNSYYQDNCTGLFGFSSTHVVMLFTIFITIYNLKIGTNKFNEKWKKRAVLIYTYLTLLIMLFYSTLNDNIAIFIFTPLFLVWYYFHTLKNANTTIYKKVSSALNYILLAIVILIAIQFIPGVSQFISETVTERFDGVIHFEETNGKGSVERLAIAQEALDLGFGWKLGKGLSAWPLTRSRYAGFRHFGLSSVGSFVYLTGIWGYSLMVLFYSFFLSRLSSNKTKLSFFITFGMVILLSCYTMFFTATHGIVWAIFIFLVFNTTDNKTTNIQNNVTNSKVKVQ